MHDCIYYLELSALLITNISGSGSSSSGGSGISSSGGAGLFFCLLLLFFVCWRWKYF